MTINFRNTKFHTSIFTDSEFNFLFIRNTLYLPYIFGDIDCKPDII